MPSGRTDSNPAAYPPHEDDESRLIESAKRGDPAAFKQLIERHSEVAHRVAYLTTRSASDAEDVVQEAFWNCFRAVGRFRQGAAFRPWLLRVVSNEAKSHSRSEVRRLGRQGHWLETSREHVATDEPLDAVLRDERHARLLRALDGLREEERLVIELRYYLDLSTSETAAAVGCPEGTVKSRLSRALMNLRAHVGEDLG